MPRLCRVTILFGFLLLPPVPGSTTEAPEAPSLFSLPAPGEITELFLRFHDEDLCRGVEAVFVSETDCVKIWCRVRDKGDYRKLLKMLRDPSECIRLEMYAADTAAEEKDDEENSLPPSLWENSKLRDILWRPLLRSSIFSDFDDPVFMISPEEIYRQHLRIFSEQTLKVGAELERYATELHELTLLIREPSLDDALSELAMRVCREHAEKVRKLAGKLEDNMKEALPENNEELKLGMENSSSPESKDIMDLAAGISESSRNVSRRVNSFIYPDHHTVPLKELRHPGILAALSDLRELNDEYLEQLERLSADF